MPKTRLDVTAKVKDKRLSMRPSDATKAFRDIAERNLSPSEINALNASGGVRVVVRKVPKGYEGRYNGIRNGRHCFTIDPSAITNEETVTHEIVHALQETKGRPVVDKKLSITKPLTASELSKKEALTEAETIARVQAADLNNTPYYDDINKQCKRKKNAVCKSPRTMKKADRKKLTNGTDRPQKARSVRSAHKNFDKLNISKYRE